MKNFFMRCFQFMREHAEYFPLFLYSILPAQVVLIAFSHYEGDVNLYPLVEVAGICGVVLIGIGIFGFLFSVFSMIKRKDSWRTKLVRIAFSFVMPPILGALLVLLFMIAHMFLAGLFVFYPPAIVLAPYFCVIAGIIVFLLPFPLTFLFVRDYTRDVYETLPNFQKKEGKKNLRLSLKTHSPELRNLPMTAQEVYQEVGGLGVMSQYFPLIAYLCLTASFLFFKFWGENMVSFGIAGLGGICATVSLVYLIYGKYPKRMVLMRLLASIFMPLLFGVPLLIGGRFIGCLTLDSWGSGLVFSIAILLSYVVIAWYFAAGSKTVSIGTADSSPKRIVFSSESDAGSVSSPNGDSVPALEPKHPSRFRDQLYKIFEVKIKS